MMKEKGNQISRGCLEPSTLTDFRDDLIENWDTIYGHTKYRPCKKFSGGTVDRATNRQIYKKHFHELPLLKNLVDTFESMLPYLSVDLVWLLRKQKKGDGFQGWHQDFSLGSRITKTIVVNVGSKETQNQDTPVSFDDGFEAEEWEEAESYANSVFQNSEDELHVKPVAIHVKNASVEAAFNELKPPATTEQDKMFEHEEQPTVYPTNNPSVTAHDDNIHASSTLLEETVQTFQDPPVIHPSLEDNLPVTCINNPSILAQDDKKSAATCLEETLLTMQQPPVMHPSLPPFGSSVDY
jgi:hypothetical protein